jgi:hypothetical protein
LTFRCYCSWHGWCFVEVGVDLGLDYDVRWGLLSAVFIDLVVVGAISSNRTLEYAEEFFHIDVLVAVLTFYLKMLMMLISLNLWSELMLLQNVFRSICYWWVGFLYYRLKLLNFSEA